MLLLPPAPKCLKAYITGTYGVSNWGNIHYFQYAGAGPPTVLDLNTIAAGVLAAMQTFAITLSTTVSATQCVVTDLDTRSGNVGTDTTAWAGIETGTQTPANVAVCISKHVARHYRGGHPRFYLPGLVAADALDQRNLKGTVAALFQTRANTFLTTCNALTTTGTGAIKMVNVGYWFVSPPKTPPQLHPTPIVEPITGMTCNGRMDSQRKRLG
jgi:hypothetical protein